MINLGLAKICETKKEFLLNYLKIPVGNFIIVSLVIKFINKKIVFTAKLLRQKGIDKHQVVVKFSNFKNFLTAKAEIFVPTLFDLPIFAFVILFAESSLIPSVFDITKQLHTQFIGIQPAVTSHQSP